MMTNLNNNISYISSGRNPYHLSVGVVLLNDKKETLALKRKGGDYTLPYGSIEEDANIVDTVFRELREETGYTGNIVSYIGSKHTYFYRDGSEVEKTTIYHLLINPTETGLRDTSDPEAESELVWLGLEELKNLLPASDIEIIERALKLVE